jgi:putative transposase
LAGLSWTVAGAGGAGSGIAAAAGTPRQAGTSRAGRAVSRGRAGWTAFLRDLVARGLSGVELVISDAHAGLREAIAAVLPGASWQRCRTHFIRNLLCRVPKSAQGLVATLVRSIFAQPDTASTWAQHARVVDQLQERFPQAAELLADAAGELLAFTAFPRSIGARSGPTIPRSG